MPVKANREVRARVRATEKVLEGDDRQRERDDPSTVVSDALMTQSQAAGFLPRRTTKGLISWPLESCAVTKWLYHLIRSTEERRRETVY